MSASAWTPVDESKDQQNSAWKPVDESAGKSEPGFLDKEIPLTSYGNATLSGLQSIGRGVRSAGEGIVQTVRHPIDTAKGLIALPAQAAQVPAAISDINASPDPLGTYAKVGQETAGQGAGQALLALGTEGLARAVPPVVKPIASRMYQSALKPSTTFGAGRVARMVDTGLTEKIPVSEGGAAKLGEKIADTNDQIAATIARNPTRTVNKFAVTSRLGDTAKKLSAQVNPEADLNAVGESGNEFLRTQPGQIAGPDAQALKQGTYRALGNRAYGELKGATVESQKALARGLKEELANAYPELNKLNATDSRLIDLHDALEKAVMRSGNREPFGIGGPIAFGATKLAGGSNPLAASALVLREALRNPAVKSRLAIALKSAGATIARPGLGASAVGLGGIAQPASDRTQQQ